MKRFHCILLLVLIAPLGSVAQTGVLELMNQPQRVDTVHLDVLLNANQLFKPSGNIVVDSCLISYVIGEDLYEYKVIGNIIPARFKTVFAQHCSEIRKQKVYIEDIRVRTGDGLNRVVVSKAIVIQCE